MTKKAPSHRIVEILEQRIAPAAMITFTDVDGDTVTVSSSKGANADLTAAAHFAASGGGQTLQLLDLTSNSIFKGTNLSITVTSNTTGHVDVGLIDATNLDLGNVIIGGDLGAINAGDSNAKTQALKRLEVNSLAVEGTDTQASGGTITDNVFGGIGTFESHGDVEGTLLVTGGPTGASGKIGTVDIHGSVVGGTDSKSGSIRASGNIKTVAVTGNITGAAGPDSGTIFAGGSITTATIGGDITGSTDAAGVRSGRLASNHGMGQVTITGGITGGAADSSGQVVSTNMTSVDVGLSITGGGGLESGTIASNGMITSVHVHGNVVGGDGIRSGTIRSVDGIGTVTIDGNLTGGTNDNSGNVASDGPIKTVVIHGSIIGGSGLQSGAVGSSKSVHSVQVDGDVRGGSGPNSGNIVSKGALDSVTITGSLIGDDGNQSGSVGALGVVSLVSIGGDIDGGSGPQSGTVLGASDVTKVTVGGGVFGADGFGSGSIVAQGKLGTVNIQESLEGGSNAFTGGVRSGGDMGTVTIGGNIDGGSLQEEDVVGTNIATPGLPIGFNSGAVLSGGKINSVTVGGSVFGGDGENSGVIETTGDNSSASDIGTVKIGGDVAGGNGDDSGSIFSNGHIGSVTLGTPGTIVQPGLRAKAPVATQGHPGSLIGGPSFFTSCGTSAGERSGLIGSNLGLGTILITGNVEGGSGFDSGKIVTGGDINSLTINGSLIGGNGGYDSTIESSNPQLGQVYAAGTIKSVVVGHNIVGNNSPNSGEIRAGTILKVVVGDPSIDPFQEGGGNVTGSGGRESGAIVAETGDIVSVKISGRLESGFGFNSGSILAQRNIGTIEVGEIEGQFSGCSGNTVNITAGGLLLPKTSSQALAIKMITVNGNVSFANILAGYDINGSPINADASIGTVQTKANNDTEQSGTMEATNIVAGAVEGNDFEFGTQNDALISGSNVSNILSSIAKIIVAGGFDSAENETTYGFVAETVVSVIVNGTAVSLTSGPHNDFKSAGDSTNINELVPSKGPPP